MPHYSDYKISSIVVGNPEWNFEPYELGEWSRHYGFLDGRPHYYSNGAGRESISFHLTVGSLGEVWMFSEGDKSIDDVDVYVELNVSPDRYPNYSPKGIETWPHRQLLPNQALFLFSLPPGTHVITLTKLAEKKARLTHVITWE